MSSDAKPSWSKTFLDHLVKHWGAPAAQTIYRKPGNHPVIQILEFPEVFPECKTFGTLGLCHYAEAVGEPAEIMLPCDDGWETAGKLLANAAFYLADHQMKIVPGISLRFKALAPDFAERFGKSALYFTTPFGTPPEFHTVTHGAAQGHVYTAFFISEAEYQFFRGRGAEAFETALQEAGIDPYHLGRESAM